MELTHLYPSSFKDHRNSAASSTIVPSLSHLTINDIPNEIIWYISGFLSVKDYYSLKSTCKTYYLLLKDDVLAKLLPHQLSHYSNLKQCLEDYFVAVDCSIMGSGKTYVACAIAKILKTNLIVFSPKTVISVWKKVAAFFGITNFYIETYAKLRMDNPFMDKDHNVKPYWNDLAASNTLLIFDECQNLKNKTAQYKSAVSLIDAIYRHEKSYVMLLSATPADKPEQMARYCRLLGIMKQDRLAHQDLQDNSYVLDGILDIVNYCVKDSNERKATIFMIDKNSKHRIVTELFIKHIKPRFFFAMRPPSIDVSLDIKNGFYLMSEKGQEALKNGVNKLRKALGAHMSNQGRIQIQPGSQLDWGGIGHALKDIERSKLEILYRLAINELSKHNHKVVCMLSYIEPINLLAKILAPYNPLIITGVATIKKREQIVSDFNNNPQCRLLICNITVTSLGISLHDTIGDSPRIMLIIPGYRVMDLHQASRRIYREGSKSDAIVRYIYGIDQQVECSLLDAISRKCKLMRALTSEKLEDIKYPSEHERYHELVPVGLD